MISAERRSEIWLTNISDSDCPVIAIQALAGLSRARAVSLATKHGWVDGVGMLTSELVAALADLGFKVNRVYGCWLADQVETVATFTLAHEQGSYLLTTSEHVMALMDGDLYNTRHSFGTPLEEALEVTR